MPRQSRSSRRRARRRQRWAELSSWLAWLWSLCAGGGDFRSWFGFRSSTTTLDAGAAEDELLRHRPGREPRRENRGWSARLIETFTVRLGQLQRERGEIVLSLGKRAPAHDRGGDGRVGQRPGERHLGGRPPDL